MTVGLVFLFFLLFYTCVESFNNFIKTDRILGGTPASIKDFPYQLAMENKKGSFMCGASIIHRSWAISAAHCVYGYAEYFLHLRSGSSYRLTGGRLHQVELIIMHPHYNWNTHDYDVSVMKVSNPFIRSDVCRGIFMATRTPSPGTPAVVSGWGSYRSDGSEPLKLHQVTVYVMNYRTCRQKYMNRLASPVLCAGVAYDGKGACFGDSGGPLVAENKLVGVVSGGASCGDADHPGLFTDVAKVYRWVNSTIRKHS